MARPPIDPSGPLVTITARLPGPHVEILDLLALAMSSRDGRPVSRGEALRRLVAPLFRGLEEAREVQEGLRRAERESLAVVRALPLDRARGERRREPPRTVKRAVETLLELEGRDARPKGARGRTKSSGKRPRQG